MKKINTLNLKPYMGKEDNQELYVWEWNNLMDAIEEKVNEIINNVNDITDYCMTWNEWYRRNK